IDINFMMQRPPSGGFFVSSPKQYWPYIQKSGQVCPLSSTKNLGVNRRQTADPPEELTHLAKPHSRHRRQAHGPTVGTFFLTLYGIDHSPFRFLLEIGGQLFPPS
ncbi:MAG: hypothetical protein WD605_02660, partial [Candidatus Paceibacterota bacterium]